MKSILKSNAIIAMAVLGLTIAGCSHASNFALPSIANNNESTSSVRNKVITDSDLRGIYSFGKVPQDGSGPFASLVAVNGTLYGTTSLGGKDNNGTIFTISTSGKEAVLHSFDSSDGSQPGAELLYLGGMLYGTARYGGAHNEGTIYRISPTGAFKLLHSFSDTDGGGDQPVAGLVALNSKLYGTASAGGVMTEYCEKNGIGCGTVFSITTNGLARVLHAFQGMPDGSNPVGTLAVVHGMLYGAVENGGKIGSGAVFRITTGGKETILHSFNGDDGAHPSGPLLYMDKELLGTATGGGGSSTWGTIFSVGLGGKETTLYTFTGHEDGCYPDGLAVLNGKLYGTTLGANIYSPCSNAGTVYQYSTSGGFLTLHTFKNGNGGLNPFDSNGLTLLNGKLYGTTWSGGNYGAGTVFSLSL
jgi:uncharacterized repeat protein (TIGR03803 family)